MSDNIKIVPGIALPPRVKRPKVYKFPFDKLAVGEMFFVPDGGKVLVNQAGIAGKALQRKFSTRVVTMKATRAGGWKLTTTDDPDGQHGVGVWRVE